MTPAIFLDRDGIINKDVAYIHKISDFEFVPGIFHTLKKLQKKFKLIIITNQSGIGRNYFSQNDYDKLTNHYLDIFERSGITITDIFTCPHTPTDNCECRKPSPKLILDAAKKHNIDLSTSWFIGDKKSDLTAGHNANIPNLIGLQTPNYPLTDIPFKHTVIYSINDIIPLICPNI